MTAAELVHQPRPICAELVITGQPGLFIADSCAQADGLVTAVGRWRRRTGAAGDDPQYGPLVARSWPTRRVEEIRWAIPTA